MKNIRLQIVLIAVVTAALSGCAGKPAPEDRGFDVVDRCSEVLGLASNLFPPDRYSFIAEHCVAPMLSEPKCRDAVMRSIGVDASTRNTLVSGACTRAYCPRMAAPKPGLCTADLTALSPSEALPLGIEFFGQVRRVELDAAEYARWEEAMGSTPSPAVATAPRDVTPVKEVAPPAPKPVEPKPGKPPKAAEPVKPVEPPKPVKPTEASKPVEPPKPVEPTKPVKVVEPPKPVEPTRPVKVVEPPKPVEPTKPVKAAETTKPAKPPKGTPPTAAPMPIGVSTDAVTLRMTVQNRMLSIAVGGQSWPLGEEPGPGAFEPAAVRAVELGARDQKVVVEMGPGIQYNHLVGILNALGRQYVSNIALSSIKD